MTDTTQMSGEFEVYVHFGGACWPTSIPICILKNTPAAVLASAIAKPIADQITKILADQKMAVGAAVIGSIEVAKERERCAELAYNAGMDGLAHAIRQGAPAPATADRYFFDSVLRCRYPVCTSINPKGFAWDTSRLDEVIEDATNPATAIRQGGGT